MTEIDTLMQKNLTDVFSERDPVLRLQTIRAMYAADAVLYEPDAVVKGHAAISAAVTSLLSSLPPDFSFTPLRAADGHHGVGRLHWSAGPPSGPAAVTGTDFAHIEDGKIKTLHVLLDPPTSLPTHG
jgi:hypothetical protein